jgi:hypothetical protein
MLHITLSFLERSTFYTAHTDEITSAVTFNI